MRKSGFIVALAMACAAQVAQAATLDFSFSFTNVANGGGTVTGIIRGLASSGFSAATSVEVTSNTAGFGVGEYVSAPFANTFNVSSGAIQLFDFVYKAADNLGPGIDCCSLSLSGEIGDMIAAGLVEDTDLAPVSFDTGLTFTALVNPGPGPGPLPPAIPLPASGGMIVAALLALAAAGARRAIATA